MRTRQENGLPRTIWLGIWIAYLAIFGNGAVRAAGGLPRSEMVGYAQWLQVLDAGQTASPLYPLGLTEAEILAHDFPRRLTAARALLAYDATAARTWDASDYRSEIQCLNQARSAREIMDYTGALRWYRDALRSRAPLGPDGALTREILATAIMSGDSLAILEQLLNVVGAPRLDDCVEAVVLAYRHYLYERDETNLGHLMEKVEAQLPGLPGKIVYWHAYALVYEGRRGEALPLLERLARDARLAAELPPAQVAWFVRALPDNLWLLDRRRDALRLYELLGATSTPAGRWARYQLAGACLLDGRYDEATPLFAEACNAVDPAGWQIRSCSLAKTAAALAEIRKEGARHDCDGIHDR